MLAGIGRPCRRVAAGRCRKAACFYGSSYPKGSMRQASCHPRLSRVSLSCPAHLSTQRIADRIRLRLSYSLPSLDRIEDGLHRLAAMPRAPEKLTGAPSADPIRCGVTDTLNHAGSLSVMVGSWAKLSPVPFASATVEASSTHVALNGRKCLKPPADGSARWRYPCWLSERHGRFCQGAEKLLGSCMVIPARSTKQRPSNPRHEPTSDGKFGHHHHRPAISFQKKVVRANQRRANSYSNSVR